MKKKNENFVFYKRNGGSWRVFFKKHECWRKLYHIIAYVWIPVEIPKTRVRVEVIYVLTSFIVRLKNKLCIIWFKEQGLFVTQGKQIPTLSQLCLPSNLIHMMLVYVNIG